MKRRFLAVILCIALCLMIVPTAFADSKTPITSVAIIGMHTPIIGQKCTVDTINITTVPANAAEIGPYWYDLTDNKKVPETDVFKEGHEYSLYVWVSPKDGYMFPCNSDKNYTGKATINGKEPKRAIEVSGTDWIHLLSSERMKPTKGIPIATVTITCTQTPVIGQKCTVDNLKITTVPANAVEIGPYWYDLTDNRKIPEGTTFKETDVFKEGHEYALYAWVSPKDGYIFPCDSNKKYTGKATINGKAPKNTEVYTIGWLSLSSIERLKPVKYAPKTYTLSTSVSGGHGGISAGKSELAENSEETVIFTPDSGYEIDKVTVNGVKTGVLSNVLNVTMDGNKTVVVTYKKISSVSKTEDGFLVVFNTNGHGKPIPDQVVKKGTKAAKPTEPTESGFAFDGWYADGNFSARFDFNTAITKDTMIYGKWSKSDGSKTLDASDITSESAAGVTSSEYISSDGVTSNESASLGISSELAADEASQKTESATDSNSFKENSESTSDKSASETKNHISIWIIIIILMLCIIAGATAVVIAKKKDKNN